MRSAIGEQQSEAFRSDERALDYKVGIGRPTDVFGREIRAADLGDCEGTRKGRSGHLVHRIKGQKHATKRLCFLKFIKVRTQQP